MKRSSSTIPSPFGLLLLLLPSSRVVLADITCGLAHGYDRGDPAYFYSGDGSLSNFDACSAKCLAGTECESFAFGDEQCLLYSTPLDSNFREQENSPFLFYDRDCEDVKATSTFLTILPSSTAAASDSGSTTSDSSGDDNDTATTTATDSGPVTANTQVATSTGTATEAENGSATQSTAGATATDSSSSGDSSGDASSSSGASETGTGTASAGSSGAAAASSSTAAPSSSSSGSDTSSTASAVFTHVSWISSCVALSALLVVWV